MNSTQSSSETICLEPQRFLLRFIKYWTVSEHDDEEDGDGPKGRRGWGGVAEAWQLTTFHEVERKMMDRNNYNSLFPSAAFLFFPLSSLVRRLLISFFLALSEEYTILLLDLLETTAASSVVADWSQRRWPSALSLRRSSSSSQSPSSWRIPSGRCVRPTPWSRWISGPGWSFPRI